MARKRGLVADVIHALFNIGLAASVILLTALFDTPMPAILLVVLSKWRVIAVRPRYWWANILSSLPDLSLGIGLAVISWQCGQISNTLATSGILPTIPAIAIQSGLGVLYAIWLIIIKPKHSDKWVLRQASISQFLGLMAIFFVSHQLSLFVSIILSFLVAFASARQMLAQYEEQSQGMLASVWGLMVAELAFVSWHWSVSYQLSVLVRVPQIAIIVTVVAFVATRVYKAWHDDRKVTWSEMGAPSILAVAVTAAVLFGFSGLY